MAKKKEEMINAYPSLNLRDMRKANSAVSAAALVTVQRALAPNLLGAGPWFRDISLKAGGNGIAAQSTQRVHFGLADLTSMEGEDVRWPSGSRQGFENLAADRVYKLVEGNRQVGELAFKAVKK